MQRFTTAGASSHRAPCRSSTSRSGPKNSLSAFRVSMIPSVYAQRLAPGGMTASAVIHPGLEQPDEGSGGTERDGVVGADHERRRVAGVRVAHPSVGGVDHGDERGEEHLVAHVAEHLGRGVERVTRILTGRERGAQHLLAPEGEDPLGRAVAGDVDDDERDATLAGDEQVVAVAGDDTFGGAERAATVQPSGISPTTGSSSERSVSTTAALCSTAWRERSDSTSC